ncbi:Receptor-like kinase [Melia azedarach]|uniref:Receptor-like kinase n=1 Tax=Melia azedarach TaxID=155640 RepID=A0ACC1WX55_MELAZ|nr:Receptor-like kinase [Melia azedarach]
MNQNYEYCKILLVLFLFFRSFYTSFSTDTIISNKPIKDGDVIVSSGKIFALGFFSLSNTERRYVGIWYNQIPEQTIVWVANRDDPVSDKSGVLSINGDRNLFLHQGNQTLPTWHTNISDTPAGNTIAQLLDSGNLVLVRNDTGETLWQSFDHPTDTTLPNMKLGWNKRTGLNIFLTSWKSPDDPGTGNCSYGIDLVGFPQVITYKGNAKWWRAGSWTGQKYTGVPGISKNYIFNISFVDNENETFINYSLTDSSVLSIKVVDESGSVKRLTWNDQDKKWIGFWSAPRELCDYYGHCGPNGNCNPYRRNDDYECTCLPGFVPKNPQEWFLRDGSGGCKPKPGVSTCQNGEGFVKVTAVKVPDTSVALADMSLGLKACEEKCLRNCSCLAYASAYADIDGGIGCLTYHGDLMDTRTYANSGQDLYLRVDAAELAAYARKKTEDNQTRKRRLALTIVSVVIGLLLLASCYYYLFKRHAIKKGEKKSQRPHVLSFFSATTRLSLYEASDPNSEGNEDNVDVTFFELSTVVAATDNFSSINKLGQGGFGQVYKGKLSNGREIAVKRLSTTSGQGILEFKNEVLLIAKLQHRNLVRLLGCCIEEDEKMLIYEFMPNKSLDYFIFDESRKPLLDWRNRFDIILGIARGILYLHQDSRLRIVHRDLKASNILLDAEMIPRISDFGTARIFGGDQSHQNTNEVVGTFGYMSPEYVLHGAFSMKSDVFSFGVLLLEIISGKKNGSYFPDDPSSYLIKYAWELWRDGEALRIVDSSIEDSYTAHEVLRCIHIALLCVQDDPRDRPTLSTAIFMLSNETPIPCPKQSTFVFGRTHDKPDSYTIGTRSSLNELTITTFTAR